MQITKKKGNIHEMLYTYLIQLSIRPIVHSEIYELHNFLDFADINQKYDSFDDITVPVSEIFEKIVPHIGDVECNNEGKFVIFRENFSTDMRNNYIAEINKCLSKISTTSLAHSGVPWDLKEAVLPYMDPIVILDGEYITWTDFCLAWIDEQAPYYIGRVVIAKC